MHELFHDVGPCSRRYNASRGGQELFRPTILNLMQARVDDLRERTSHSVRFTSRASSIRSSVFTLPGGRKVSPTRSGVVSVLLFLVGCGGEVIVHNELAVFWLESIESSVVSVLEGSTTKVGRSR